MLPYSFIVVDGKNLMYRAHSTHRSLSAAVDGEEVSTGGTYGFLSVLSRLYYRYKGRVYVAWEDPKKRNFRFDIYPEYKARPQGFASVMAEEVEDQIPTTMSILRSLGVNQYLAKNSEADDVIGRLVTDNKLTQGKVLIYSGDSDMCQLVDPWVHLVMPKDRKEILHIARTVRKRFGIGPKRVAAFKALAGDSSDNIPGAKGVGPVAAATLLNTYGSLKGVLVAARQGREDWPVAERLRTSIAENLTDVEAYYSLTRIRRKLPMRVMKGRRDKQKAIGRLKKLKMHSLCVAPNIGRLLKMGVPQDG